MAENEKHSEEKKPKIYHAISLVIIGIGVGWLTGLSISPVVAGLLSSIIGAVLVLAAILSGFSYGDNSSPIRIAGDVSPVPFALLMVGIIAGTSSGIWVRTHNVLGVISAEKQDNSFTKLQEELTQLKKQEGTGEGEQKGKWEGLDIPLSDIAQRIIDKYYPKGGEVNKPAATDSVENKEKIGGLMAANAAPVCKDLLSRPMSNWRSYIQMIDNDLFTGLDKISDDSELEKRIHSICKKSE